MTLLTNWAVDYGNTFYPSTNLGNVQSVYITNGRQWQTDPYSPASCTIQCRNVDAWITPPKIGNYVAVYQGATNYTAFAGWIKDVEISYGTIPSLDTATITCEGPLSRWGRRQFTNRAITQAGTLTQIMAVATAVGLDDFTYAYGKTGQSIASAQTYVGNGLDLLNTLMQTEIGHVAETVIFLSGAYEPVTWLRPRQDVALSTFLFSDAGTSGYLKYDSIRFDSAAENYYTQVTIQPQGLATQTSGSGFYGLTQESYDYTTGQALSHAQYLESQYNTTNSNPISITATYNNQTSAALRSDFRLLFNSFTSAAGEAVEIEFRGDTYMCVIEGREIVADLNETVVTLHLSAFDNNNYLILNNAVYGTLGTSGTYPGNKLGF